MGHSILYSEVLAKRFLACLRLSDGVLKLGEPSQVCDGVVVLVKVFVVYVVFIRVAGARYERESDEAMNTPLSASYSQFKVSPVVLGCKYLERFTVANSAVWVRLIGL